MVPFFLDDKLTRKLFMVLLTSSLLYQVIADSLFETGSSQ